MKASMRMNRREALALILIVFFSFAISFPYIEAYYREERNDWKGVAEYLEENSQIGDVIITEPGWYRSNLLHYYNTTIKNNVIETITDLTELNDIVSKNERVWIIYGETPWDSGNLEIGYWLHSRYGLGERFLGTYEINLFLIQPTLFKVAIFHNSEWDPQIAWLSLLGIMGASIDTFEDSLPITNINFTDFDLVVFADILRPLSLSERIYLQESVRNGSIIIVSGVSPESLSGGTPDLFPISSWFGSTFYIGPSNAILQHWRIEFTDRASEIQAGLNLDKDYKFYTGEAWSRPIGCIVTNDLDNYAVRKEDGAGTIFAHEFGDGISIFVGPRLEAVNSPDIHIFRTFIESLIRSLLMIS